MSPTNSLILESGNSVTCHPSKMTNLFDHSPILRLDLRIHSTSNRRGRIFPASDWKHWLKAEALAGCSGPT